MAGGVKADPPIRKDGTCAACRKPRGHSLPDPFCSMECCRAWHGATIEKRASKPVAYCVDCRKQLPAERNGRAGARCRVCSDKEKRRRYYHGPGVCAGCGVPHDEYTQACYRCRERRYRRQRRQNPEVRARELAYARKSKQRGKLASAGPVAGIEPSGKRLSQGGGAPLCSTSGGEADVPAAEEEKAA